MSFSRSARSSRFDAPNMSELGAKTPRKSSDTFNPMVLGNQTRNVELVVKGPKVTFTLAAVAPLECVLSTAMMQPSVFIDATEDDPIGSIN